MHDSENVATSDCYACYMPDTSMSSLYSILHNTRLRNPKRRRVTEASKHPRQKVSGRREQIKIATRARRICINAVYAPPAPPAPHTELGPPYGAGEGC